MTSAELGAAVGESAESITHYELRRSCPTPAMVGRLAAALNVPVGELLSRHQDPTLEYVDAVAQHGRPMNSEEIHSTAAVLRNVRRVRLSRPEQRAPT